MKKLQVAILGRNYTSLLGMIRAVGELECEITVIRSVREIPNKSNIKNIIKKIAIGKTIEESSKYVDRFLYTLEPDREYLVNLLLEAYNNIQGKIIIIPTDDFTASTIDLYQDKLKNKFLFPTISNTPGEIVKLMDKNIQKEIALKHGLNVAKSYIVNIEEKKYDLPKEIKYPVFTKPQISFKGDKTFMQKCNTENELQELLNKIAQKCNCPILIEEYIYIEKEYAILGYCDNNKVIMPGIIEMLESGTGGHKGVTLKGKITPIDKSSEIYNKLNKLMKSIKFKGLFDIDLYEQDGKIYFNELNLRFGASGYAITHSGVNLPKQFINDLLDINKKDCNLNEITPKIFINEKVNLEEYISGNINWHQHINAYKNTDFSFVYDKNDIKPYKQLKKLIFLHRFKKIFKK